MGRTSEVTMGKPDTLVGRVPGRLVLWERNASHSQIAFRAWETLEGGGERTHTVRFAGVTYIAAATTIASATIYEADDEQRDELLDRLALQPSRVLTLGTKLFVLQGKARVMNYVFASRCDVEVSEHGPATLDL
ncbi:MAG: hypothetical protein AAF089_13985 [Bacteroidota bacterium]